MRKLIVAAICVVAGIVGVETTAAAAPPLPGPTLTITSFAAQSTGNPSLPYTFSFTAAWTRVENATIYELCVGNLEAASTCWAFRTTTRSGQPYVGRPTLSFSAGDLPGLALVTPLGIVVPSHLPFSVTACAPQRGCTTSDPVEEIVPS